MTAGILYDMELGSFYGKQIDDNLHLTIQRVCFGWIYIYTTKAGAITSTFVCR